MTISSEPGGGVGFKLNLAANEVLSLPLYPNMTDAHVSYVIEMVREAVRG